MTVTISHEELKVKIECDDQFTHVETLTVEYYLHTHLYGALNLPPDQVKDLASTLLPDKGADIFVYFAKPT